MSESPIQPPGLDLRRASATVMAALTRLVGPSRLDLAEDATQDALLRACRQWSSSGVPTDPIAWLLTAGRRSLIDRWRRHRLEAGPPADEAAGSTPPPEIAVIAEAEPLRDDTLRMLFLCCHPALPSEVRVPLMLKECGGFVVSEIATATGKSPETIAQRLVRAKRKLRDIGATFELPTSTELLERSEDVRACIYAIFTEGYRPAAKDAFLRPELVAESLHLVSELDHAGQGRDPLTAALAALLAFHAARLPARRISGDTALLLEEQDRSQWDRELLSRAFIAFERSLVGPTLSRWHIEASIASLHAMAASFADTDWSAILHRYDQLLAVAPTAAVQESRWIALSMARGPTAALREIEACPDASDDSPGRPAVQAFLRERSGQFALATQCWLRAALHARSPVEAAYFHRRALTSSARPGPKPPE